MPNALEMQVKSLPELIASETWRLEDRLRRSVPTPVQLAIRHLVLTGCGDSGIAGQAVEQTFRDLTGIPTVAVDAMTAARFLFPLYDHQYPRTPMLLAVSNSGEVARVVEAAQQARSVGGYVVGLTANSSSRLAEASDVCLDIAAPAFPAAPGMRSYVMAVLALNLYAVRFAEVRGRITMDQAQVLRGELAALAGVVHHVIVAVDTPLRQLAADWAELPCIEFLGSGPARASAAFGVAKILESTGQYACSVDVEEFVHVNYFARAARRTGTVLIAPPGSPAAGRAEEVGRYLNTLQRPWVAIGNVGSAQLHIPLPNGLRQEFGPLVHAAVLGLLAAHLMTATGETPGRGSVGPWADSAGGATARNSVILHRCGQSERGTAGTPRFAERENSPMAARFSLQTTGNHAYDIQSKIDRAVTESGVRDGIAVVLVPHTTAALGIISCHDPLGLGDVMDELDRLMPARVNFKHQHDTPQDAAGHVRSTVVGPTLSLIVQDGAVVLGHSQKVFFLEFDGPRKRQVFVQIVASAPATGTDAGTAEPVPTETSR